MMIYILGMLASQEEVAPFLEIIMNCEYTFHMQTNQCFTLNYTPKPPPLSHTPNQYSPGLNHHRARYQTTRDHLYSLEPGDIIQTSPSCFPCPALLFPWKPQYRLWAMVSPDSCFRLPTKLAWYDPSCKKVHSWKNTVLMQFARSW